MLLGLGLAALVVVGLATVLIGRRESQVVAERSPSPKLQLNQPGLPAWAVLPATDTAKDMAIAGASSSANSRNDHGWVQLTPAVASRAVPRSGEPSSRFDLSPVAEATVVSRNVEPEDLTIERLPSSPGPARLHQVKVDSLAALAAKLDALPADGSDLVLVLPARAAVVLVEPEEMISAARLIGGICVAASAVPLASPALAEQLKRAVAESAAKPVRRCHCVPHALVGTAAQLRSLLADLPSGDSDADRLTAAVLAQRHEIVLDTVSYFFHTLDGTGTDMTIVAGRAHVGGERPLVLIDPAPGGRALASAETDLADRGAGDLARLLRYDGAAAPGNEVTVVAPDVRVTRLWTKSFCATVIRAAEVAGLWANLSDDSTAEVGVSLADLMPPLVIHLEADLAHRVWPLCREWQALDSMEPSGAMIIRQQVRKPDQRSLATHDAARIMGSVRLNDGYAGGALALPDQRWDDSAVPVGALTLWPSDASHPHRAAPVTRGVKYTLRVRAATDLLLTLAEGPPGAATYGTNRPGG